MGKRKLESDGDTTQGKRQKAQDPSGRIRAVKVATAASTTTSANQCVEDPPAERNGSAANGESSGAVPAKPRHKINKLVPPRPFPTVPTSVSATGPRSAHTEGKNFICLTRKTPLGMYMRRCKDVILKDGYKTLHLSAMGAAIPHLLQLSVALPPILPFSPDEIHTEVLTGTVEVQDEVIPDDEDEDVSYQTRGKSTLSVVIKIGDGKDENNRVGRNHGAAKNQSGRGGRHEGVKVGDKKGKEKTRQELSPKQIVLEEPEQDQ